MPEPAVIAALLIALAVLAAVVRLVLHRRDRRTVVLAALSLASGGFLYLTLFPPRLPLGGETLVVATAAAPRDLRAGAGERLVALPEAAPVPNAERVPDLATALRRYPQVAHIRIVGTGLPTRDRDGDPGVPVAFQPPPFPRGLISLEPPARVAAGAVFTLAGQTHALAGGSAELLDPAGRRIDARRLGSDGGFTLGGTARAPGAALFTLRLRDAGRAIVSDTPVPQWTVPERPVRMLLIGAPSPENKYLRRWAADAGIALVSQLEAGGGVRLGDAPVALDAATLRRFDVVVIDDRNWHGLGGGRGAIASAVANGLGLVIRMTGPAAADVRGDWRALGLAVAGGDQLVPVALPPLALDADALAATRGPNTAEAGLAAGQLDDPAPDLGRWDVRFGAELVPVLADTDGAPLAAWRARGQGRVALWAAADSYALLLSGQRDRYYQWWSDVIAAVGRAEANFRPVLPPVARAGERMVICGLTGRVSAVAAGEAATPLVVDAPTGVQGCAAFWPKGAGFYRVVQASAAGAQAYSFHVYPAGALTALQEAADAAATARWARDARGEPPAVFGKGGRGPAWPWFLAWLIVSGGLWWLGRRRATPGD